jgi:hypothetical protein
MHREGRFSDRLIKIVRVQFPVGVPYLFGAMNRKIENSRQLAVLITLPADLYEWVKDRSESNSELCREALELLRKKKEGENHD